MDKKWRLSGIFSKINEKISKNKMQASPKNVVKEISKNTKPKKSK